MFATDRILSSRNTTPMSKGERLELSFKILVITIPQRGFYCQLYVAARKWEMVFTC